MMETVDSKPFGLGLTDEDDELELALPRRVLPTTDDMPSRTESFNSTASSFSQASDFGHLPTSSGNFHRPALETVPSVEVDPDDAFDAALWELESAMIRHLSSARADAGLERDRMTM